MGSLLSTGTTLAGTLLDRRSTGCLLSYYDLPGKRRATPKASERLCIPHANRYLGARMNKYQGRTNGVGGGGKSPNSYVVVLLSVMWTDKPVV